MSFFESSQSERTERPTARRRRQARERGVVARSTELLTAARLLAIWSVAVLWCGGFAVFAAKLVRESFEHAAHRAINPTLAVSRLQAASWQGAEQLILPLSIVTVALLMAHFGQTGWIWNADRAAFSMARLSPTEGLKRLFGVTAVARSLAMLVKLSVVVGLTWFAFEELPIEPMPGNSDGSGPLQNFEHLAAVLVRLISQVAVSLLAWGIADYFVQRWRFERSLQMTRDELRQEFKETEGNAGVKSRQKNQQAAS